MPDLRLGRRRLRRQPAEPRQAHPLAVVVGGLVLGGGERDAPATALVVGVRLREPRAEQPRRALQELLAVQHPAGRALRGEAVLAEGAMEGCEIVQVQPPIARLAVPVRRQDRERESQVVDVATVALAPVIGGVQEVGDPRRSIAAGDRRAGHPREVHGTRGSLLERTTGVVGLLLEVHRELGQIARSQCRLIVGHGALLVAHLCPAWPAASASASAVLRIPVRRRPYRSATSRACRSAARGATGAVAD